MAPQRRFYRDTHAGTKWYQTPYKKEYALYLRKNQTEPEKMLWKHLQKGQRKQNRFTRQKVIYGWIVDFYTHDSRVAIEVDGKLHEEPEQRAKDKVKDRALNKSGIYVLRIPARDIYNNMEKVLERIDSTLTLKGSRYSNG